MSRLLGCLTILSTLALSGIVGAAEFFPSPWDRIGPEPTAITVHGAADIDPRDTGIIYFVSRGPDGTRVGEDGTEGFWKSEDGGETWTRIDAAVGSSVNSGQGVRIDPLDPDRVFVGQEDVERWSVSVDTGVTFSPGDSSPHHIICTEFDPIDSDIVYVGTDRAVYKSADAGDSWVHQIGNGLPPTGVGISSTVTALAADSTASGTVYAGFLYGEWETPWGVYKTTDGGASWAPRNRGLPETGTPFQDRGLADLAIARSRPQTLYAASYFTGQLFRTDDGAEHWVEIPGVPFPDTFDAGGAWPSAITVDPDDPDRVLVGTNEYSVFLSNDGGRNFTALGYVLDVEKTDQNEARVTMPDGTIETGATVADAVGTNFPEINKFLFHPGDKYTFYAPSPVGLHLRQILRPLRNLHLDKQGADVVLTWNELAGAASYRVYAADSPSESRDDWVELEETTATTYVDPGAAGPPDRYYSVLGVTDDDLQGEW